MNNPSYRKFNINWKNCWNIFWWKSNYWKKIIQIIWKKKTKYVSELVHVFFFVLFSSHFLHTLKLSLARNSRITSFIDSRFSVVCGMLCFLVSFVCVFARLCVCIRAAASEWMFLVSILLLWTIQHLSLFVSLNNVIAKGSMWGMLCALRRVSSYWAPKSFLNVFEMGNV